MQRMAGEAARPSAGARLFPSGGNARLLQPLTLPIGNRFLAVPTKELWKM